MSPASDPITVSSASTIFSDDFATGDFSNWTGVTRLTIDNGTGGVAPPSARGAVTNQSAFAYKTLADTYNSICMSANVNATSIDSNAPTLFRLRTAGNGPIGKVFVNSSGVLYARSDVSNAQIWSGVALGNGWHNVEACVTVGTSGTWDLYRDGVKIVDAWTANTGTTPVGRVEIGNAQAITATINFDDVVVDQPQVIVDTDPPTTPGKPSGTSPSAGKITISWTASTDASPPITYTVHRDGSPIGTTTSTSYTDMGLTPGSQHTYTVDATDNLGNGPSAMSPASDSITVSSASTIFSDDFATGDFSNWTGVTRLTIDNGTGGVAPPSARGAVTNQSAFAYKTLASTYNSVCMSVNVNATSIDPSDSTLFRLRTAGNGPIGKVFVNSSGVLYARSDVSNAQIWSGVALGNGWHNVEACVTVGTSGTWDLYRDGVKIVDAWTANTGTTPVGRVDIGNAQAYTATFNYDDVVVDQSPG